MGLEMGLGPMRWGERSDVTEASVRTITGWVGELNVFGFRVGRQWVARAEGGVEHPRPGEYAEVALDTEGYAVHIDVRAWRPVSPCPN